MKSHRFFDRFRERRQPDAVGEEGILDRIDLDGKGYYAKHWYSVHGDLGRRLKLSEVDLESKSAKDPELASRLSPFWHKVKYYEYRLIAEQFPDLAVKMVGAFEPRLQKGEDGKMQIAKPEKFPVTVTEEIVTDPAVAEQRDQLIDAAYQEIFSYYETHGRKPFIRGVPDPQREAAFESTLRTVVDTDASIRSLYGLELESGRLDPDDPSGLARLVVELRSRQADPRMTALLEAGILPMHPEFNFLPTEYSAEPGQTKGVFLELLLIDPKRFLRTVMKTADADQAGSVARLFDRYMVYRASDQIYTELLPALGNRIGEDAHRDPAVQSAMFRLVEEYRRMIEKRRAKAYNAKFLQEMLENAIVTELGGRRGKAAAIAALDALADRLRATGAF
jgi:hypothetical protein